MTLKSNLPKVLAEIERKLAQKNEAAAIIAEGGAKARAPVGTPESTGIPNYRGGRLRSSITHDSDALGFIVGVNLDYAAPVHNGTYSMNMDEFYAADAVDFSAAQAIVAQAKARQASEGKGMAPRPFFIEGILDKRREIEAVYKA